MGEVFEGLGPARASRGVKFRYFNPRASRAYIAGEFNNWQATDWEMCRHSNGVWETVVPLGEGAHEYKFVVDGEWTRDPHNPCMMLNEHGTVNSVVEVAPGGEVRTPAPRQEACGFGRFKAVTSPDWVRDAVIYEVFPRVFSDEGNLEGVTRGIPRIADLGATCIWLMPIHDIGRRGRKGSLGSPYAIYDYLSIHPDLGTPEDLSRLVRTAHDHGIRVIMDFVANHSALDCPLTVAHPEWYRRDAHGNIQCAGFGWDDVVAFDYTSAELRGYMIKVMRHYVEEFDIDGYRCDVAALVPTDFWRAARRALKAVKPDALLLAESHEPAHNAAAFDVTYEETLPKILEQVLSSGLPARAVKDLIENDRRSFPMDSLRLRYLENHDQLRAMHTLGRRGYEVAATCLFTLDGIPLIYNGQEIGEEERPSLFDPFKIRWEAGDPVVIAMYRDLCNMRRHTPALRRGSLTFLDMTREDAGLAYYREHGRSRVLVALNFTGELVRTKLAAPGGRLAGIDHEAVYVMRALRGQLSPCPASVRGSDLCSLELALEPYGVKVLDIREGA
ncbi:MAG: alpha-amylase family glycosyl hydrolase [Firmicutes bacterium]|nr:alpha-amylase family glycosyl hydrolase [Bacillota bacterium]MDH7496020.1 alpha-amylase family glycosyl hydrolase [Bacillota bacterium]